MGDDNPLGGTDEPGMAFRDKVVSRGTALACAGMSALFLVLAIAGLADGVLAATVAFGVLMLVSLYVGVARAVIRTAVTRDGVRVQWGLQDESIPFGAITDAKVREAGRVNWTAALREPGAPPIESFVLSSLGRSLVVPSSPDSIGHVVEITWHDAARQKPRRAWLGVTDPDGMLAAIHRGRTPTTGVRVDAHTADETADAELPQRDPAAKSARGGG